MDPPQDVNLAVTGSKNSSRVLKPPGGGSSVIFGSSDANDSMTPKRFAKFNQAGSLGGIIAESGNHQDSTDGKKPTVNSHARLFGAPDPPAASGGRNRQKSNIILGDSVDHHDNGHANGHADSDSASVTSNGSVGSNGSSSNSSHGRSRVPPGGYSTALW